MNPREVPVRRPLDLADLPWIPADLARPSRLRRVARGLASMFTHLWTSLARKLRSKHR